MTLWGDGSTGAVRVVAALRTLGLADCPRRMPVTGQLELGRAAGVPPPSRLTFRDRSAVVGLMCDEPGLAREASIAPGLTGLEVGDADPPMCSDDSSRRFVPMEDSMDDAVPAWRAWLPTALADAPSSPRWTVTLARVADLDRMPLAMAGGTTTDVFAPGVEALWRRTEPIGETWWMPDDRIVVHHRSGTGWIGARYADPLSARRWAALLVETALHLQHGRADRVHVTNDRGNSSRHRIA